MFNNFKPVDTAFVDNQIQGQRGFCNEIFDKSLEMRVESIKKNKENGCFNYGSDFVFWINEIVKGRDTCCLISAGPSSLKYLSEVTNKTFNICVDSAYRICKKNNVPLDLVVSDDIQGQCKEFWNDIDNSKDTLLMNAWSNPEKLISWRGKIYYYWTLASSEEKSNAYHEQCKLLSVIAPGACVANIQYAIVYFLLKFKKMIFLGYDFCWEEEGKFYADEKSNKLWAGENQHNFGRIETKANSGKTVLTSHSMINFKDWLDTQIAETAKVYPMKYINCSDSSILGIRGMVQNNVFHSIQLSQLKQTNNFQEAMTYVRLGKQN